MHILILGNGIAGTNAARFIRKRSNHRITMISDETLQPFSRTALMYIYMGHLRQRDTHLYEDWFWPKNRIERIQATVTRLLPDEKAVLLEQGEKIHYDKLIIATGSVPNKFGWPGQELDGVQGLYHLQDLEKLEKHTPRLQRAVITGGGLIGIELAEMLHSRGIPVTFLVREKSFWNGVLPAEESEMVNRHIREHGIDLRLGTELSHMLDDGTGAVGGVVTTEGETISCQLAGLTAGVRPNIDFLKDSSLELGRGVLVNEHLQTSDPDIYAIGDCAELRHPGPNRRSIEAVWYTGRMMGQTVAATLCGEVSAYVPRLWFNSAKFFDIEYQVYGYITHREESHIRNLYWEHPDGKKSVRIQYTPGTGEVLGFNLMGIRFRHEVCEKWILEKTPIEEVLANLRLANFDPEFFKTYEKEIVRQYNSHTGRSVTLQSSGALHRVREFLNRKNPGTTRHEHPTHS